MLERFTAVTLIVDGKRYIAGLRDLEPVDDAKGTADRNGGGGRSGSEGG
jgi:hypothetical protein